MATTIHRCPIAGDTGNVCRDAAAGSTVDGYLVEDLAAGRAVVDIGQLRGFLVAALQPVAGTMVVVRTVSETGDAVVLAPMVDGNEAPAAEPVLWFELADTPEGLRAVEVIRGRVSEDAENSAVLRGGELDGRRFTAVDGSPAPSATPTPVMQPPYAGSGSPGTASSGVLAIVAGLALVTLGGALGRLRGPRAEPSQCC